MPSHAAPAARASDSNLDSDSQNMDFVLSAPAENFPSYAIQNFPSYAIQTCFEL